MDQNQRKNVKNPCQNANPISKLTFWWTFKLFLVGNKRELEESDLYSPLREDKSSRLGEHIVKAWGKELKRCAEKKDDSKPQLVRVLFRCFGKHVLVTGLVLTALEFGLRILQPFLLAELLRYFSSEEKAQWGSGIYYCAAAFTLLPLIDCFAIHWILLRLMHAGMKVRVACCTLIYRKILRLSNAVLETGTSTGQMVNFLSNDVNRLDYVVFGIHYLWIGPVQTILIAYLMYREIGWAAIAGMIIFLFFIPIQLLFGKQVSRLTLKSARRTDDRLSLMNQIIAGVEVIKMYVWEIPYSLLVEKARRKEVDVLRKYGTIEQFGVSFDLFVPRLCLFFTILTYVLMGNNINAEKVFMASAFYNILRNSMTVGFPLSVNRVAEALVSIRRLEIFMAHSEISKPEKNANQIAAQSTPVYLKNVTARWDSSRELTLNNIDLTVKTGQFIAITGQVGSGKSSLLQAILRELPLEKGVLETEGKISYASQRPWIFASSIKQNVLFGQSFNEARYNEIIKVCQLKPDIDSFPHGDRTIVGERGINLSGGQKARINLARALYTDSDIYLLDDPLSAVDSHVASRIMEECICGYLKNKTRILVTHQIQYLKFADSIIVMNNGSIQINGKFEELQNMNLELLEIFKDVHENKEAEGVESKRTMSVSEDKDEEATLLDDGPVEVAETKSTGKISSSVYLSYLKASKNVFLVILMPLLSCVSQATQSGSDYLLAFWVNLEVASFVDNNGTLEFQWDSPIPRDGLIYLYSALTISILIFSTSQILLHFRICMRSSKNLHAAMFRSIIRANMYFYNTNPAGRVLNRFSKDIGVIDNKLPFTLFDVLVISLIFFGTIAIVGIVNQWLLIPTLITICIFYFLRVFYISTSRAVKRMEGTTRSPVFDHVGATLQGLTTIRAFQAEKILTSEFDNHQDLHSSAWFIFISISRGFGLYIELFCLIYVGIITISFFVFDDLAVAGDIGLVITQIIAVTGILQWGMRQTAELETQITSIERVLEYSRLKEEPFLDSNAQKPPEDWPSKGLIEFKDVKLKYGPNDTYALKNINFVIMPKEKIGVVGRTGAGKTSLISALFRLAPVEGDILIDGVSTGMIALHDFRSKISIIPQEPILFGGTLRRNLDPFDEYPDNVLWNALQEVELKETISDMAAGLNSRVAEEGLNFSVGQRQLLCLVRALVKSNKIMVLDEATANVDLQTDSLIQKTVRKKFIDCTVFTIAHRLNTIMDSDNILVMDQGRLVEFDHPYVLLQKKGYFYNMVEETGASMSVNLFETAKNSFYRDKEMPS